MSSPTTQRMASKEKSTSPLRQHSPQYSFPSPPSTIPTVKKFLRTNTSTRPPPPPSTLTSSSTNSSTISTLKPLSSSSTYANIKRSSHQWFNNWFTDWWGLEIITWVISACSLLAIVTVLESYRGRPLPEWPLSITVNSLVSVFATIGQMAMMNPVVECISQLKWLWFIRSPRRLADFQTFNDASRGPTGSLLLLGKLRGLYLVSLGAAITIIAIAFGPVSQQVVSYPLHLHAVGNGSAPQALSFHLPFNMSEVDMSPSLAASSQIGVSGETQTLSDVIPFCNTGNCTWASYSSLGICASTIDISSFLINNTCNATAFNEQFDTTNTFQNPGYPCFNYSLPVSALSVAFSNADTQTGFSSGGLVYENNASLTSLHNSSFGGGYVDISMLTISAGFYTDYSITDLNILYQPGIETSINSTLPPPIAIQSTFELCVQTYNTTVFDSNTTTHLVSSQSLNATLIQASVGNTTFDVNGTTFSVNSIALMELSSFLSGNLVNGCSFIAGPGNGTILPTESPNENSTYCSGGSSVGLLKSLQDGTTDSVAAVNTVAENIAISMTNSLRNGADGWITLNSHQGIASLPISFVETNYIWFTLPAALVLLTLIFLIATITQSQRLGAKNWKSSDFASLRALDGGGGLGGLENLSVMEEWAEETLVEMGENGDGRKNGWSLAVRK